MTPYTIPRHFKDQASPRSTPTTTKKNNKSIKRQKPTIEYRKVSVDPQFITRWIMIAQLCATFYRIAVAGGHLAGYTINCLVHSKLWSCPGLGKVPSLSREQGKTDESHLLALFPTSRFYRHFVAAMLCFESMALIPIIPSRRSRVSGKLFAREGWGRMGLLIYFR